MRLTEQEAVDDALAYARTYWQHGQEPRTQQALTTLAARLAAVEAERDEARAARRAERDHYKMVLSAVEAERDRLRETVERVEALAADLLAFHGGHGDFLTAGKSLSAALDDPVATI